MNVPVTLHNRQVGAVVRHIKHDPALFRIMGFTENSWDQDNYAYCAVIKAGKTSNLSIGRECTFSLDNIQYAMNNNKEAAGLLLDKEW